MAGAKILIVDDEEDVRALLSRMLKPHGFEVETASGPDDALKTLEAFQPDLLITDIKMPGMDGVELARVVKKLSPQTGVIVMTAYATADSAIDSLRLGVDNYIKKPIKLDELADAVRTALDRRHGQTDTSRPSAKRRVQSPERGAGRRRGVAGGVDGQLSTATGPRARSGAIPTGKPQHSPIHLVAATPTARERSSPSTASITVLPFHFGRESYGVEGGPKSGTDLTVRDEPPFQVSRDHCAIEQQDDGYYVRDLNSRLGTIVNGERIGLRARDLMAPLKPGQNTLVLGNKRSPFVFGVFVKG